MNVQFEAIEDPAYSGVVLSSGDWRVIAGPSGRRYWLQRLRPDGRFGAVKYRKLARALADVLPPDCPFTPAQLHGLPESAADAAPDAVRRRSALNAAFHATNYLSDDYARTVVDDGLYRLVVSPDASSYIVLRSGDRGRSKLRAFRSASAALAFVLSKSDSFPGRLGVEAIKSDLLRDALGALPDDPAAGEWQELPERPESARERRQRLGLPKRR